MTALVSASVFFAVDPALAFKVGLFAQLLFCLLELMCNVFLMMMFCVKGGGPYGSEVTRGQDLTGKDFSGKTLIKQDFKTVSFCV